MGQKSIIRDDAFVWGRPDGGIPDRMDAHLQNDPDRAGGLISDAQGEFVAQESGGVFDPRAFRSDTDDSPAEPGTTSGGADGPPMDEPRMVGPGEEIDKAR